MQPNKFTSVRRIYGATGSSTNDLAHIDIVADCVITGIDFSMSAPTGSAGDRVRAEVSTSSVCQATTNDCIGVIANCDWCCLLTTSGAIQSVNKFVGPCAIFVPRGTRIFLSTVQAGTASTSIIVNLHVCPI